ncbi:vitamin B12 transporter BtuB precursor [Variibacter gotjawalensis]|uniref:Vitamin B12 transporter BtuB n=1 Tax=Variibacter gotjawalensis TaxID=1333996 RepID=A0A0S3PSS4_9BRAD|nr:TonB-dependent receptor [Variibacter gotjawalensis]NIK49282.1 vitamin B12 transporter [Variibacter gotjawalensis]RZS51133.1 vitamin B12 transporter [Variibacter gotjawalensis]BAT58968.1 vitamin B12 transporter BtuB precursor [Variibacter gotjawalensis]
MSLSSLKIRHILLASSILSVSTIATEVKAQATLDPVVVPAPQPREAVVPQRQRTTQGRRGTRRATRPVAPVAAVPAPAVERASLPTTVPTPVERIGSSVTVIGAAQIERDQRRTVPEVLQTVPGLVVVPSGGPGNQTSVFMRGTNSNHVKVLVDGISINDPATGLIDFGNLAATGDIERVEVLRGPQSGLYGSDALGGIIAITAKRGEGPPKAAVTLEGGSFGTFNQNVNVSGSHERFDYAFNVSHFRAESVPVTPLELLPPGQRRINDFYDNLTFSTKLGAQLTENFRINFVARYTDATLRFTGDGFDPVTFAAVPNAQQSRQQIEQFATRGEAVWQTFDGRLVNTLGANYFEQKSYSASPDGSSRSTIGDRTRIDWRSQYAFLPGQFLIAGADHEIERFSKPGFGAENSNTGGWLELQAQPFERAFLAANVRYDENEHFGGHTTWRVAPSYIIAGSETKLKGSVGTGFKAPTLSQLFEDFPDFFFFGNPNLKPEESLGYDIGFEQPLAGGQLRVGAVYFHNDITNLISTVFLPDFTSTLGNINRATTRGVEAFVSAQVTDRIKVRADWTYTDAIDEQTKQQLIRRPRNKGSVTVAYSPYDPLTLSATVLYIGEFADRDRTFFAPTINPGYTLLNVAANYQVNPYTKVFARVDNLTNEKYEPVTGFLGRGIGVYGGVRVTN